MLSSFRQLKVNLKYTWLKFFGWQDAYHSCLLADGEIYEVYITGKRHSCAKIKKIADDVKIPEGIFPWYVEYKDGCHYYIHSADSVVFLPPNFSRKKSWFDN